MSTIRLAYSTFGLTGLPFLDALTEIDRAGYAGAEISFHRDHFNPFTLDDEDLAAVRRHLDGLSIQPACVATASHFFDPFRPHDPSLMAIEPAARQRRIDLIRRGIHVARKLDVPLVTFGSGFLRPEHARNPQLDPTDLLAESIHECLREIRDDEDITLLIEPEPGMLIETTDEGLALIEKVNSPRFKLHMDLCHAWCSDDDCLDAIARAAPQTRYLHISDAVRGWNLKIVEDREDLVLDMALASWLVHFPASSDFLLVDRNHPIAFCSQSPSAAQRRRMDELLAAAGVQRELQVVDYQKLLAQRYAGPSELDSEIFVWMISIPHLSFDVLNRAWPIAAWLRRAPEGPQIDAMVANTRTGIVHFHEIPGYGELDLKASFKALTDNGFSGYGAVELYHHVESWQEALSESWRNLAPLVGLATERTA